MHLGVSALLDFYREHRTEEALVLATIMATEGSTYRKPGAMMLICRDGHFEGLISGGCLETDLLQHAEKVFASGQTSLVTYDMHADENLAWNLGLGCDGVIHLLLQRLDGDRGFSILDRLDRSLAGRKPCLVAVVTGSPDSDAIGQLAMVDNTDISEGNEFLVGILRRYAADWPSWRSKLIVEASDDGERTILLIHVRPPVQVLICGAGPDAIPVAQALVNLDWKVTVTDYRPAYLKKGRLPQSCALIDARPPVLAEKTDLKRFDAAVIMSHHLENDAEYLRQLAGQGLRYLGLLGPAARRHRLKEMANCPNLRLHGPAGLDIGAELPASIALSIVAEIHAVLNDRLGGSLLERSGES